MRRLLAALTAALLLLSACSRQRDSSSSSSSVSSASPASSVSSSQEETQATARELAAAILASQEDLPSLTALTPEDGGLFPDYLEQYYGIAPDSVTDAVICVAEGAAATEVAVLKLAEGASVREAEQALAAYQEKREGDFTGYAPEQAALVENGLVASSGSCLALILCPDPEGGRQAFLDCFRGSSPAGQLEDYLTSPSPASSSASSSGESSSASSSVSAPGEASSQSGSSASSGTSASSGSSGRQPSSGTQTPQQSAGTTPQPTQPSTTPGSSSSRPSPQPDPAPQPAPQPQPEPEPEPEPEPQPEPEPEPEPEPQPEPEPEPEPEPALPDEYRAEDVKQAYASGDTSGLTPKNLAVLEKCREILSGLGGLSPYQQELAVHDWIIRWGEYDSNTLTHDPGFQESPDNDNPYGFLTYGKGICLGYTTTFQLCMDLLNIECITVRGTAYSATEDHAWNMVKLDGQWYCVDCTWDDPISAFEVPQSLAHRYFNCTSDFLRQTDHQWDTASVPEATATAWAWKG